MLKLRMAMKDYMESKGLEDFHFEIVGGCMYLRGNCGKDVALISNLSSGMKNSMSNAEREFVIEELEKWLYTNAGAVLAVRDKTKIHYEKVEVIYNEFKALGVKVVNIANYQYKLDDSSILQFGFNKDMGIVLNYIPLREVTLPIITSTLSEIYSKSNKLVKLYLDLLANEKLLDEADAISVKLRSCTVV